MNSVDTTPARDAAGRHGGLLYPLMLIAAVTVIVFSVAGIATMMGWLPSVQSRSEPAAKSAGAPASAAKPAPTTGRPRVASSAAACGDCGVVESIRAVEAPGEGSGLGAIGGAVFGGVLGNQIGRGRGRAAATVMGAGAGAYAGHEIEKNVKKSVTYQVRVRMNDGTYRTFQESAPPPLAVGQRVRVTERGPVAAG